MKGPASVKQHREWMALHGGWEPHDQRPSPATVERAMTEIAHRLKLTEDALVEHVAMRGDFTAAEWSGVEAAARQAIVVANTSARRAGLEGRLPLTNDLFDAIARRWSPAYGKALETTPARCVPEMRPETLRAAQQDLRCVGIRLGPLFSLARQAVSDLYKTVKTRKGKRLRALKARRHYPLLLADAPPQERVPEHRVTGEIEYSRVISGKEAVLVMDALEQPHLTLNAGTAREELARMEAVLAEAQAAFNKVQRPHKRVATVVRKKKVLRWEPPYAQDEIDALIAVREAEGPVLALRPVVAQLPVEGIVTIRTQMRQSINRRFHAATFGVEAVGNTGTDFADEYPETIDEFGDVEGPVTYTSLRRGRMFRIETRSGRWLSREPIAGVDVSSSMYQIMAALLGDAALEDKLRTHSAHEIAAEAVWPGDADGPARAKQVLVAGGYGSRPSEIEKNTGIPLDEVRTALAALGPQVARFQRYTRLVAKAVPKYEGFTFSDPFDRSPVTWYPVRARPQEIASNTAGASYKLRTYVPTGKLNAGGRAPIDRAKLGRQLAPMLIHACDAAFNGFVMMNLIIADVPVIAINDAWLTAASQAHRLDQAVRDAGEPWMRSLGPIYDALLKYPVDAKERRWMRDLKRRWAKRLDAGAWPVFRTKPVTLVKWE
jgi:hypothetical protein